MKTRILYLNPIGEFSGASKSLAELLKSPRFSAIEPVMLCPEGGAADYFRRCGFKVVATRRLSQFDHTRHGRYRGIRWLVALRELLLLPGTRLAIKRAEAEVGPVAAIHLNEITGIYSGILAQKIFQCPLIMHVRAHMGEQGSGMRAKLLWDAVKKHVAWSICIDETVAATVPATVKKSVVHNSFEIDRTPFKASPGWDRALAGVPSNRVKAAIVGSLLRVKGLDEFMEAASLICRRRQDIHFFIVGRSVRRFGGLVDRLLRAVGLLDDIEQRCRQRIQQDRLESQVTLVGHVEDPRATYRDIDILCFPSHYNATGRPVIEAAFFGKPSIVAIENPKPDTLVDGVTGIAIPAHAGAALAEAIEQLAQNASMRNEMGQAAKKLALQNCDVDTNALNVLEIYRQVGVSG